MRKVKETIQGGKRFALAPCAQCSRETGGTNDTSGTAPTGPTTPTSHTRPTSHTTADRIADSLERIADALEALVTTTKEKENLPPTPPIREKETNDNNNSRAREKAKRFKKPTVKEVADYIREMRYSFDAAQFVAYYTAVGWKVGRNPMKDWKAACSTWQRRQQSEGKPGRSAAGNPQRRKADNWVGSTEEQRKGLEDAFRV